MNNESPAWFCLRAKQKNEHIVAGHLLRNLGLEVFAPRIRFQRPTQRGVAWVTEPLFPSYLFAKFKIQEFANSVQYSPGIHGIVQFGGKWPAIPDTTIEELRQVYGQETVHVINRIPQPGDSVEIAGGTFHGLKAIVTRLMPARDRVAVLLDFLGRQTVVELGLHHIVKAGP